MVWRMHLWMMRKAMLGLIVAGIMPASMASAAPADEDIVIAQSLAEMLLAGQTVISREQDRINDPTLGDKGSTAER
jgi:hypothetical protein